MTLAWLFLGFISLILLTGLACWLSERVALRRSANERADREADQFLADLHGGPLILRPHGLLILDEAPWEQTRLILKGEIEDLPETPWGRAQYSRFLCWRADMVSDIGAWHEEVVAA